MHYYFDTDSYYEELNRKKSKQKKINAILAIAFILTAMFISYVFWDIATENIRFSGGKIVDKYRDTKYGTSYITVLKDGKYRDLDISINDYLEYDIGDIYNAQE